jgi:hypothetical protein
LILDDVEYRKIRGVLSDLIKGLLTNGNPEYAVERPFNKDPIP